MPKNIKFQIPFLSKLANNYFELIFAFYLLSGVLKGIYLSNGWEMVIDFTLVSGATLCLLGGINIWSAGLQSFLNKKLWRILLLFVFYLIATLSISYSPSNHYAYIKAFLFLTNIVAIMSPIFHPNFRVNKFIKYFTITAVLIGIYSFIVYGFYFGNKSNILGLARKFYRGFYLDSGYILGLALILALKLNNSVLKVISINLLVILLWASAARGPIIFTFISILIYISAIGLDLGASKFLKRIFRNWQKIIALILVNVVVISIIYSSSFGATVFNRTLYRFSVIVPSDIEQTMLDAERNANGDYMWGEDEEEGSLPSQSSINRLDHYIYSWNMINKTWKTQVIGHGFGSYGIIKTGKDQRLYPHNIFLEIWFETGIIGLVTFLFFMIQALLWTMKNNQHILGIAILYLLANTFKSYSLVDHRILMGIMGISMFIQVKRPAFNWLIIGRSTNS